MKYFRNSMGPFERCLCDGGSDQRNARDMDYLRDLMGHAERCFGGSGIDMRSNTPSAEDDPRDSQWEGTQQIHQSRLQQLCTLPLPPERALLQCRIVPNAVLEQSVNEPSVSWSSSRQAMIETDSVRWHFVCA